MRRLTL